MASPALPLSEIVNVSVLVTPQSAVAPQFNQGLIVGPTTVIPSVGANSRLRKYLSANAMLTDGFLTSSPEYIAAQMYFSQTPAPVAVWIGRQDATAIITAVIHAASEGSGYVAGDILTVVQGGASGGTVKVATVSSGAVTGVTLLTGGTGYAVANGLATTGGSGSGAQIDISNVGETPLIALTACRVASDAWWACMVTTAVAADHAAIAAFVQSMQPVGFYFYTTGDAAVLNNTVGNVGAVLKAASYTRTFGVYSTTQSGTFPNNIYACAVAMGVMMGLNTGLPNSYATLKFKTLVGVASEPLTVAQQTTIENNNVNLYLGYANSFTILEQGQTPTTNTFADEILNRDILTAAMQFNIMNLLVASPSVPQTNAGQTQLIHAVNQACAAAVVSGYLSGGTWQGVTIAPGGGDSINFGDSLPAGYKAISAPYSTQLQSDHIARKAMPIFVAVIEAGAVHFVTIGLYIQP